MPSAALADFVNRMSDIEQLLTAHRSVTQLARSQAAVQRAAPGIGQAMAALSPLVNMPGRGRPAEVGALNRAAIVLISAHLEGYVEDIYSIAASSLLTGKVREVGILTEGPKWRFRNPSTDAVRTLFMSIGMVDIFRGISWRRANEASVRTRLNELVKLRNAIAHGTQPRVSKARVNQAKRFTEIFANKLDEKVGNEIVALTGKAPW